MDHCKRFFEWFYIKCVFQNAKVKFRYKFHNFSQYFPTLKKGVVHNSETKNLTALKSWSAYHKSTIPVILHWLLKSVSQKEAKLSLMWICMQVKKMGVVKNNFRKWLKFDTQAKLLSNHSNKLFLVRKPLGLEMHTQLHWATLV